jgi:hypothetical protein
MVRRKRGAISSPSGLRFERRVSGMLGGALEVRKQLWWKGKGQWQVFTIGE